MLNAMKPKLHLSVLIGILFILLFLTACGGPDYSVTLTWIVPTTNTNGTALADLAGYEIHIGSSSRNYTRTINVNIGDKALSCLNVYNNDNTRLITGKCNYTITGLQQGSYYVAISARNSLGTKSDYSNEVVKTALPSTGTASGSAY
jgi:hypothetical protein